MVAEARGRATLRPHPGQLQHRRRLPVRRRIGFAKASGAMEVIGCLRGLRNRSGLPGP